jgi:TfoX/Sxy family transcriptional regulator of competence genes
MASEEKIVDFIIGQIQKAGTITAKKMFGEYCIYSNEKLFGVICDNKLFIKLTKAGRAFIGNPTELSPYVGAKPSFVVDDKIDDSEWLSKLVSVTVKELPEPKPKGRKK